MLLEGWVCSFLYPIHVAPPWECRSKWFHSSALGCKSCTWSIIISYRAPAFTQRIKPKCGCYKWSDTNGYDKGRNGWKHDERAPRHALGACIPWMFHETCSTQTNTSESSNADALHPLLPFHSCGIIPTNFTQAAEPLFGIYNHWPKSSYNHKLLFSLSSRSRILKATLWLHGTINKDTPMWNVSGLSCLADAPFKALCYLQQVRWALRPSLPMAKQLCGHP